MQKTVIFVSDIHLGAQQSKYSKYAYQYDWLTVDLAKYFYEFLKSLLNRKTEIELVILGDLFDTWVCPVDIIPPSIDDIVMAKKNKKIINILNKLSSKKNIKITYVPGNHDMSVSTYDLKRYFPNIYYNSNVYKNGLLYAEHGHRNTIFNSIDLNGINNFLPLGYFISRVVATSTAKTGTRTINYAEHIDNMFKILGPITLSQGVFFSVLDEAKLSKDTPIIYKNYKGQNRVITANEVGNLYKDLYYNKIKSNGNRNAIVSLLNDMGFQKMSIDKTFDKTRAKVIINGHTHNWTLEPDLFFVKDRIFANSGAWCEPNKPQTFIEITSKNNKTSVSVYEWNKNHSNLLREHTLDFDVLNNRCIRC